MGIKVKVVSFRDEYSLTQRGVIGENYTLMIKSMTGYARSSKLLAGGRIILELHCVNKRMLEFNVNLPRQYLSYELVLRDWLRQEIPRGQVTVRVHFEREEKGEIAGVPSARLLKPLKERWEKVARSLGYDPKEEVTLFFLLSQMPALLHEDLSEKVLKEMVDKALSDLNKMKEKEGAALAKDLRHCLDSMRKTLKEVEKAAPKVVRRFEERLREKIKGFRTGDFDEKLAREVVLFADKVDVNEEIVRLNSHFDQIEIYLSGKEKSVGRTLEFLTQEVHRELNTLSAKVADSDLVHKIVGMKNELGKFREQIQNIE